MRTKVDEVIVGYDGQPFDGSGRETVQDTDAETGAPRVDDRGKPVMVTRPKPLTLREVLLTVYSAPDNTANLAAKLERGTLAARLFAIPPDGELELTSEQAVATKELLGKLLSNPVVTMRAVAMVDPTAVPEDMRG